jgi:outer membrane protein TolC
MALILLAGLFFAGAPAVAAETEASGEAESGLTIEEAVNMALEYNKDLKSQKIDIEKSQEIRDLTSNAVQFIPTSPTTDAAYNAYMGLVQADISLQMLKKSRSTTEDQIAYSVLRTYLDLLGALENYDYQQKTMEYEQLSLNIARVTYGVGMLSDLALEQANAKFKAAQATAAGAEVSLTGAYQNFNKTVGLSPEARPELAERPEYSTIDVLAENLEAEIGRVVQLNPQIWQLDQQVTLAHLNWVLYEPSSGNSSQSSYTKTLDIDKAELSADKARISAKEALRSVYNSVRQLEESYPAQLESIKTLESNLRLTQVRYDLGMATKSEVKKAELDLLNQQKSLNSSIYQHELLKITFSKPWAAGGA